MRLSILNGGSSVLEEKNFVNELYNEKAKNDSNSKSLSKLLNVLTKTVFGDANRFIFELLQNADDSPTEKGDGNLEVTIKLLDKHLIFSHTGKHFSKNDVKGISDVGSGDSGKINDINKTGYKGIGFKSVFGTCDKVYILSSKFSFKFDKNHSLWEKSIEYPWQIIPIWVEKYEIEAEIQERLDINKVNFVISIKDKNKIKNEISEVFSDPKVILFLRHVNSIKIFDQDKQILVIERKKNDANIKELYVNGVKVSEWLCKEFIVPVDNELHEKLQFLESAECPNKLKEATSTKITFAAAIENDIIQELSDTSVYCYLPTKAKFDFPFLVNSDFLTNAERTEFIDNEWNSFILKQIAICNIKWLSELAKQVKFKYQFTKLLKNKFTSLKPSLIKRSYNDGIDKAISEIAFIPLHDSSEKLIRIADCVLDYIGLSTVFDAKIIIEYYNNNYRVADSKIQNQNKLTSLGAKRFDISDLCKLFQTELFREKYIFDIEFNFNILNFLHLGDRKKGFEWSNQLKSATFLINDSYKVNAPEKTYFPLTEEVMDIINIIEFNCLNLKLYERIKENKELKQWLDSLGVKEPSEIEIFRKSILRMIENDEVNVNNVLQVGKFVFRVFQKGKLTDNDYKVLSRLKLLTSAGSIDIPGNCYLLDCYEPELKIENILTNGRYVSDKYVQYSSEFIQWKELFTKIGVKEKIIIKIESSIERASLIKKYPLIMSYIHYIDSNDIYPYQTARYKNSGQHGFRSFVYIDYLEYLNDYDFSKSFWKIILANSWSKIYNECKKTVYYTMISDISIESFLQFYIRTNSTIPANDGKCYKSTELYSASLKKVVTNYYPVVDDEILLSKEQEEFLGIRTTLTIQDCLNLLKSLESEKVNSNTIKQIDSIYKQIIKTVCSDENINQLSCCTSMKLLATNNSFQLASNLYCFDIKELLPLADSSYFLKVSESINDKDIEKLCAFFCIPIVKYNDLKFITQKVESEQELLENLRMKAKYLATIVGNISGGSPSELLIEIMKKLENASFYKVQSLSMVYINRYDEEIYRQKIESCFDIYSNSIYYVGTWRNPLTLYSLSNSLCSFLALKDKEREIALILQLSDDDIINWFVSKEYKVVENELKECNGLDEIEMINYKDVDVEEDQVISINPKELYKAEEKLNNGEIIEGCTGNEIDDVRSSYQESILVCVDESNRYEIEKNPKYLTVESKILIATLIKMEYEEDYNHLIKSGKLYSFLDTVEGSGTGWRVVYKTSMTVEERFENIVWDDNKKLLLIGKGIDKDEIAYALARKLTIPGTTYTSRVSDSIELFLGIKDYMKRLNKKGNWIVPVEVKNWIQEKEETAERETQSESREYFKHNKGLEVDNNISNLEDSAIYDEYRKTPSDKLKTSANLQGAQLSKTDDIFSKEYESSYEDSELEITTDEENENETEPFYNSEGVRRTGNQKTDINQSKRNYRLISYASSEPSKEELSLKNNTEKDNDNLKVEEKARKAVINYEKGKGRIPLEMPSMQESYDITSYNEDNITINRFIRVSGFIGEWNTYDVALISAEQMKAAKIQEELFWLYVVEHVEDEQHTKIYRIQNPFEKITRFAFDHGWRGVAEQDNPLDKYIVGAQIIHNTYGPGTIKSIVEKGHLKLLTVTFGAGEKKFPLNITQMRIKGEN